MEITDLKAHWTSHELVDQPFLQFVRKNEVKVMSIFYKEKVTFYMFIKYNLLVLCAQLSQLCVAGAGWQICLA